MGAPSADDQEMMFRVYAVCTLILFFKYFFVIATGVNPMDHPAEDVEKIGLKLEEKPDIKRHQRCQANDMENIPFHYGIFIFGLFVQMYCNATNSDEGKTQTTLLTFLFLIYTVARTFYTVCYKLSLQPFRTIFFVIGTLCIMITTFTIVSSAFLIKFEDDDER